MVLLCSQCRKESNWGTLGPCSNCRGVLRVEYSSKDLAELCHVLPGFGIDRYRRTLPATGEIRSLGEAWTPLVRIQLSPDSPCREVFLKCEGLNPSGSFKDRVAALAVSLAGETHSQGVLTASSGNSASAMATYCAAAGMPCAVMIEPGNPITKTRQILAMGAQLLPVNALFDLGPESVRELLQEVASGLDYYLGFAWAPVNPYLTEALKTISYEIYHQLGGASDWVVTPVGGGDLLHGMWKGWKDLRACGLVDRVPRMAGVQSKSAPPLVQAFQNREQRVPALGYANSRISGMNVPFSGDHALDAIRQSGGCALGVADELVFEVQCELASEQGIWVEPAAAAAVAGLRELFQKGWAEPGARIVCVCTGAGFKDPYLAHEEAEAMSQTPPVARDPSCIIQRFRH